ncbi:MAG: 4Fe-4S dicluster domain-containing protein [Desulfarculaceae bacterium]|nr:4Fe-4S dicluster domain-containing protein [Desulfarculaceae bacterium]MCF8073069.1 4Fe-4S dicluster domain-containing protein [Desulfarculaceae bacterium]MCF8101846.1 4Fe-4S dicluster domain-containing protein [Desulfarculaceae bacterium]MCF8115373.1 4Fe-4S dicluster domain-containing protein [Desulfarculaceae bacterium]
MAKDISRRNFLRGGLAAAAGVAASPIILPTAAQAASGRELCTLLDLSKCIGCEECVSACREQWQPTVPDPVSPMPRPFPAKVPVQDWSGRKDVSDRLTPYNFLYVEHLDVPHKGQEIELHVPRRCMHCLNPPCADLCPFGAGRVENNGVVHIDPEVCLGGAKCKTVCPWKIPQRQSGVGIYLDIMPELAGNGVMFKCHRCLPLVEKGQQPRCVEVCPEQVQSIGPREQILAQAEALARAKATEDGASPDKWQDYVYGLTENGGTTTIYVSPMPFAAVAAAIEQNHAASAQPGRGRAARAKQGGRKKKRGFGGRPPMGPVEDVMAKADNLSLALVLAPVAGLAAGFTRLFGKKFKADDGDSKGEAA